MYSGKPIGEEVTNVFLSDPNPQRALETINVSIAKYKAAVSSFEDVITDICTTVARLYGEVSLSQNNVQARLDQWSKSTVEAKAVLAMEWMCKYPTISKESLIECPNYFSIIMDQLTTQFPDAVKHIKLAKQNIEQLKTAEGKLKARESSTESKSIASDSPLHSPLTKAKKELERLRKDKRYEEFFKHYEIDNNRALRAACIESTGELLKRLLEIYNLEGIKLDPNHQGAETRKNAFHYAAGKSKNNYEMLINQFKFTDLGLVDKEGRKPIDYLSVQLSNN